MCVSIFQLCIQKRDFAMDSYCFQTCLKTDSWKCCFKSLTFKKWWHKNNRKLEEGSQSISRILTQEFQTRGSGSLTKALYSSQYCELQPLLNSCWPVWLRGRSLGAEASLHLEDEGEDSLYLYVARYAWTVKGLWTRGNKVCLKIYLQDFYYLKTFNIKSAGFGALSLMVS